MQAAFYSGTKPGFAGVYNRGVRWIESGSYSHTELVFSNGESASASFMDGGVRFKDITYTSGNWDFVALPWADEAYARKYFEDRDEQKYDIRGNIHFILGFIKNNPEKQFCSGIVAGALQIPQYWWFAPNALHAVLTSMLAAYDQGVKNGSRN
jgi:hypothetical protein